MKARFQGCSTPGIGGARPGEVFGPAGRAQLQYGGKAVPHGAGVLRLTFGVFGRTFGVLGPRQIAGGEREELGVAALRGLRGPCPAQRRATPTAGGAEGKPRPLTIQTPPI